MLASGPERTPLIRLLLGLAHAASSETTFVDWPCKSVMPAPKSSLNAANFMARGAHAPSRVAVGAPAGRFFSFQYNLYWSSPGVAGALGEDLGGRTRVDTAPPRVHFLPSVATKRDMP